jgi:mRNA interferase RelE/StbE
VARYSIVIKTSAIKEIEAISNRSDRRRVVARIRSLAHDPRPRGCEKLAGGDRYRVRQGVYRIIYSIEDDRLIVHVVKVGHRRDVYRR